MAAFRWAWAALAALIGGALAGSVPLEHPAVLWWPVMGWFLYKSGDYFIHAFKDRSSVSWGVLNLILAAPFAALALVWVETPAVAGHPPLFWWPVAAYWGVEAIHALILAASRRTYFSWVMLMLAFAATGAFALGVLPGPEWLDFEHSPSPGLANLAAFVAVLAAWYLLSAILYPSKGDGGYLDRVFGSTFARIALDVFVVLGGAAIIVSLARLMAA